METSLQVPKKKSPVWDYFVVSDDESLVKCCSCELKISHGSRDTKTYGTTNLSTHLRIKHPGLFKVECDDRVHQWNINDDCSQRIHKRFGEMIALDCHLFSLVEDEGFTLLRELEPRYSLCTHTKTCGTQQSSLGAVTDVLAICRSILHSHTAVYVKFKIT